MWEHISNGTQRLAFKSAWHSEASGIKLNVSFSKEDEHYSAVSEKQANLSLSESLSLIMETQ